MDARPWGNVRRKKPAGAGIMALKPRLEAGDADIVLNLPTPPSVNELYLNNKTGSGKGRIKTAKYRQWIAEATFDLRQSATHGIAGKYTIHILVNRKTTGADIWNLEKATSDLLQTEGVISNDKHSNGGSIYWSDAPTGMRVTVQAVKEREPHGD